MELRNLEKVSDTKCREWCIVCGRWAGANQHVHWFLGGKGLGIQQRNECMGWFARIW